MDYDNFRQMVLGANIKPVKTTEMNDLMGMTNQRSKHLNSKRSLFLSPGVMNAASSISFSNKGENSGNAVLPEGNLDINESQNARDFKKYFDRILKLNCEQMDRLNIAVKYLENIPKETYSKVFGLDFAVDDLMKIANVFVEYCQGVEKLPIESAKIFVDFFAGKYFSENKRVLIFPKVYQSSKVSKHLF